MFSYAVKSWIQGFRISSGYHSIQNTPLMLSLPMGWGSALVLHCILACLGIPSRRFPRIPRFLRSVAPSVFWSPPLDQAAIFEGLPGSLLCHMVGPSASNTSPYLVLACSVPISIYILKPCFKTSLPLCRLLGTSVLLGLHF